MTMKIEEQVAMLEVDKKTANVYSNGIKRNMDVIVAAIAFVVVCPIIILFCMLTIMESKGSPIFLQRRIGIHGKSFYIIKIRSMKKDAEKDGPQWANENDPRVTKIGRFIRKTRIDELPQLINVVIGDMSLVGPRPEREVFIEKFESEIPGFSKRLQVKPGLTGWAQVHGGYNLSPHQKLRYDLFYIRNQSMILDLKIMMKTCKVILTGNGAR
ncbi:sugar transferase [Bacillus thuringiensis]|nr:sugar transferase [Bacillus thuringiensis]MDZ3952453.1 sugar transferase [Bacillus thuringiensis]